MVKSALMKRRWGWLNTRALAFPSGENNLIGRENNLIGKARGAKAGPAVLYCPPPQSPCHSFKSTLNKY